MALIQRELDIMGMWWNWKTWAQSFPRPPALMCSSWVTDCLSVGLHLTCKMWIIIFNLKAFCNNSMQHLTNTQHGGIPGYNSLFQWACVQQPWWIAGLDVGNRIETSTLVILEEIADCCGGKEAGEQIISIKCSFDYDSGCDWSVIDLRQFCKGAGT